VGRGAAGGGWGDMAGPPWGRPSVWSGSQRSGAKTSETGFIGGKRHGSHRSRDRSSGLPGRGALLVPGRLAGRAVPGVL